MYIFFQFFYFTIKTKQVSFKFSTSENKNRFLNIPYFNGDIVCENNFTQTLNAHNPVSKWRTC